MIYLIKQAVVDRLESKFNNAFRYVVIGYVDDKSRIPDYIMTETLVAKDRGWPLQYANGGQPVRKYIVEELYPY